MDLPVDYRALSQSERREVRKEYIKRQAGLCCYCGAPLEGDPAKDVASKRVTESLFPHGFFDFPVHLHHNHVTGLTIGAVHCHCNAVAWEYDGE